MPEGRVQVEFIGILPADPFPCNDTAFFQILHQTLYCPFRNAYGLGHFPEWHVRMGIKVDQDVAMITEEGPVGFFGSVFT